MTEFADKLYRLCAPFFELSGEQLGLQEAHYELMVRWNRVLNLTRVVALDAAVRKHYGESVFLASQLPTGELRIADVGSGAGFPGVPIAISRPDCSVTLIESHQRKAAFLKEATRGLSNVCVLGTRAELVSHRFDWVVSRAVRADDVLALKLGRRYGLLMASEDVSRGTIGDASTSGVEVPRGTIPIPWDADSVVTLC